MKLLSILSFAMLFVACSREWQPRQNVPLAIQQKLVAEYQGVKSLRWYYDGEYYTAHFRRSSYNYLFRFDTQANLLQRTEEMPLRDFPNNIKEWVAVHYPTYQLRKGAIELQASKTDTVYIAEIQRGMKFYDLYFSPACNLLEKKVVFPEDKQQLLLKGLYW
ncbi:MAG: hypothetical protein ACOVQA_03995 [Thermoflexibacteraceae bacterium]|jgi:hypothetical protein